MSSKEGLASSVYHLASQKNSLASSVYYLASKNASKYKRKLYLLSVFLVYCSLALSAQTLHIKAVEIEGQRRTRERIIRRELDFSVGDSLPMTDLMPRLKANEERLLNTNLFISATCNVSAWEGDSISIKVVLKETWYIYPVPALELGDRNFNVWWFEQHHKLNRLNLGLWINLLNFTGRNDFLKIVAQVGYQQKYEAFYRLPYFNRKQSLGLTANVLYSLNREVAYKTEGNKLQFFRDFDARGPQLKRFRVGATLLWRRNFYTTHEWGLNYLNLAVTDTITKLNPNYFLNGSRHQQSLNAFYLFTIDRRDVRPYPTKGYRLRLGVEKIGLGIISDVDKLFTLAEFAYHHPFAKRWHTSLFLGGQKTLYYRPQPYYNQNALGYGSKLVRGYAYYVIDGQDFALVQTDLHYRLFSFNLPVRRMPLLHLKSIPSRLYARAYADAGYVYDRFYRADNPLNNKLLFGTGIGLDLILLHNIVLQAELGINKEGEVGVYFRQKFNF